MGVIQEPYIISSTFRHFGFMEADINALYSAVNQYNSLGIVEVDGQCYRFQFNVEHNLNPIPGNNLMSSNGIVTISNMGTFKVGQNGNFIMGEATDSTINIYPGSVDAVNGDGNISSTMSFTFAHEIGHTLGLGHTDELNVLMSSMFSLNSSSVVTLADATQIIKNLR